MPEAVAVDPESIGAPGVPDSDVPGGPPADGRTAGLVVGPWAATALVVVLYVAAGVAVNWSAWRLGATTSQGPGGDQFANIWYLQWAATAITHGHNPFFSADGNVPWGVNLLANTSSLLLGALGTPLTLIWNSTLTFNVLLTAAPAASALAAYALARRWSVSKPAAFVAGLVYGFGPYAMAQGPSGGHLNLAFTPIPPLVFLILGEVLARPRGRPVGWGIGLGALLAAQFFVAAEVLLSTIVTGVAVVVWAAVVGRRHVRARAGAVARVGAWAGATVAVLLVYPVWFAFRGPSSISGPIQLVPQAYRSGLEALVVPDVNQRLHTAHLASVASHFSNSTAENGIYLGIPLLVVLVVGAVWLWRRFPVVPVVVLTGLSAGVLSFGARLSLTGASSLAGGVPFPEVILAKLPVLSNTVPSRYALYVDLAAGLLLAMVLDELVVVARAQRGTGSRHAAPRRGVSRRGAGIIATVVAVVCLIPLVPSSVSGIERLTPPTYFTSGAYRAIPRGSATVLFPYPSSVAPTAQFWQATTRLHFKILGGYFLVPAGPARHIAFSPELAYTRSTPVAVALTSLAEGNPPALTPRLTAILRSQLRRDGVSTVVAFVEGIPDPIGVVSYLTEVLGYPPRRVDDAQVWSRVGDRLPRPTG